MNVNDKEKLFSTETVKFWFFCSLLIPIYYCTLTLCNILGHEYIVQDDARQHIVWFKRFVDHELFPGDLIADYFMAYGSSGLKFIYWLPAQVGLDPMVLAKLLPIPISLVATAYFFGVCLQIFPLPIGAFFSTLIFNQGIWFKDDVLSATSRGFVYPFFSGFLFYLLKGKIIPCFVFILIQALFYPMISLVSVGILIIRLIQVREGGLQWSKRRSNYILVMGSILILAVVLCPLYFRTTVWEPQVTAAQMKVMPEFSATGRTPYFGFSPLLFWTHGNSGIRLPLLPPIAWLALLLPWLRKKQQDLTENITSKIGILWQILLPSIVLFIMAHIILIRLYLPSRYTYFSFRFIMPIAAGIVLTLLLNKVCQWIRRIRCYGTRLTSKQTLLTGLSILVGCGLMIVPLITSVQLRHQNWIIAKHPELYRFIAKQPKDTMVASLSRAANNIPSFSERSILVGRETANSFHLGYYQKIRKRAVALISAQYSTDFNQIKQLIQTYNINLLLIDKAAFSPDYIARNWWLMQFQPVASDAIERLQQGKQPILKMFLHKCSVLSSEQYDLLDAHCIELGNRVPKSYPLLSVS